MVSVASQVVVSPSRAVAVQARLAPGTGPFAAGMPSSGAGEGLTWPPASGAKAKSATAAKERSTGRRPARRRRGWMSGEVFFIG